MTVVIEIEKKIGGDAWEMFLKMLSFLEEWGYITWGMEVRE